MASSEKGIFKQTAYANNVARIRNKPLKQFIKTLASIHIHTYIYTYIHTYIYTYIHTYIHKTHHLMTKTTKYSETLNIKKQR